MLVVWLIFGEVKCQQTGYQNVLKSGKKTEF